MSGPRNERLLTESESGAPYHVAYREYGAPGAPDVLVCVHGLSRNGRDFDTLARALCDEFRVVTLDVVGRGESDDLPAPEPYDRPAYFRDYGKLFARLQAERLFWLGTSMGGLHGMALAAAEQTELEALVLNDAGSLIPKAALQQVVDTLLEDPSFATREELDAYLEERYRSEQGPYTEAEWKAFLDSSSSLVEGRYRLAYDPRLLDPIREGSPVPDDVDVSGVWAKVAIPTLIVRGERSAILPRAVATDMVSNGPRPTELYEVEGVGHAPTLNGAADIERIRRFLAAVPP